MENAFPLISVVIVNFNAGDWLCKCVHAVLQSNLPMEVFVADNGSTDRSLTLLRATFARETRLRICENKVNLGFAKGNNNILPMTSGEYVLLLNPDCVVQADVLKRMCQAMQDYPDAGLASCLVKNTDGSIQANSRRFIPTPWRSLMRILHVDMLFSRGVGINNTGQLPTKPIFVEGISGAFMLVRRSALQQVGALDEGYFLHCDDLDWFVRFQHAGWKLLFVPDVYVVHTKGACSQSAAFRVLWHKHKGMARFYRKFFYYRR